MGSVKMGESVKVPGAVWTEGAVRTEEAVWRKTAFGQIGDRMGANSPKVRRICTAGGTWRRLQAAG